MAHLARYQESSGVDSIGLPHSPHNCHRPGSGGPEDIPPCQLLTAFTLRKRSIPNAWKTVDAPATVEDLPLPHR